MIVAKRVNFEAAHYLPNYEGKCKNLHGHHWVVEIAVSGQVMQEHGFVVDFSKLKTWMEENIVSEFDHTLLNDSIPNPTAENIALVIKMRFDATGWNISGDIRLAWVKVWETEDSYVQYEGE